MSMRRAVPVLAVAALVLTGCGSHKLPEADARPTSSPSPTAPPGVDTTLPDKPTRQARTPESSVEYAGWFAQLVQYAIEARDARPVTDEAFDQAGCMTCRKLATFVADLKSGGYWQLSEDLDVGELRSTRKGKATLVTGGFVYPELHDVKVDGSVAKTIPATTYRYSVDLTWDDSTNSWRVLDYAFQPKKG